MSELPEVYHGFLIITIKYFRLFKSEVQKESTMTGETRGLLWEEYQKRHKRGYLYSQFCRPVSQWCGAESEVVLRLNHKRMTVRNCESMSLQELNEAILKHLKEHRAGLA